MERVQKMEQEAQLDNERRERINAFQQLERKEEHKTSKRIAKRRRRKERRGNRTSKIADGDEVVEGNVQRKLEGGTHQ